MRSCVGLLPIWPGTSTQNDDGHLWAPDSNDEVNGSGPVESLRDTSVMSHGHRCCWRAGQASNQDICAGGTEPGQSVDTSFSRQHHQVRRRYPESHTQAGIQPLSRPRASQYPLQIYPLVTDLAADGVPVAVTCRVLGFSKQGYYRWRASPVTERDWADAHLVNAALDIHIDDPAFGYRFIADELPGKGVTAGENRVQRLCKDHGIWSVFSKKRGLNRNPGPPVHDDLVERDFTAAAPNELWLTDITEHPTGEGKLYLCGLGREEQTA